MKPETNIHPTQVTGPDPADLASYLARTRWFGGKGRPFSVTDVRRIGEVPGRVQDGPRAVIHLVEVTYDDVAEASARGSGLLPEARTELYQVPLSFYTDPQTRLDHAFVGWWEDPVEGWVHAYDALHDRAAMACWLRSFDRAADHGIDPDSSLAFHRLPGHDLDTSAHSTLFSGEQSNSSVAFGEDSLMKVFRKVTPGVNPDIQVHEVLTRAGSERIASLYGWLDVVVEGAAREDGPESGTVIQLAMLQQFLRTASDGWDLALTSVRDLFSEGDLHADEVGGDFAGEATRLGEALREVHDLLAERFPTGQLTGSACTGLADAMARRLDAALLVVPGLAEHADRLGAAYRRVGELESIRVQQVHGDLHLGQTLRTALGWKIVDFEGEPARPLADRLLPDSPWRDVAGMMRSLDYAPHVVERAHPEDDMGHQLAVRAAEWASRNKDHFLVAYAGRDLTPDQRVLLDAYTADKAVYECLYETRNRPTWVPIPLAAIARIGTP